MYDLLFHKGDKVNIIYSDYRYEPNTVYEVVFSYWSPGWDMEAVNIGLTDDTGQVEWFPSSWLQNAD